MRNQLLALSLAACAKEVPPPITTTATPVTGEVSNLALDQLVTSCVRGEADDHVPRLREAILRNDGDLIRTETPWFDAWLVAQGKEGGPPGPSASVGQWQEGDRTRTGALMLAKVGSTCGECHGRVAMGPTYPPIDQPADPTGVVPHMQLRGWVTERLWEGLIGPSEARWQSGLTALLSQPLPPEDFEGREEDLVSPAAELGPWIQRIGLVALRTGVQEQRAELYADLLNACAECHAGTAGAPDPQH